MSFKSIFTVFIGLMLVVVAGCGEDEPLFIPVPSAVFTVTIENVFEEKAYFEGGTFAGIDSSESVTFRINAGPGQHLSLAASRNDTTDLFFATPDNGIPLYVGPNPQVGDITSMIRVYDAGTYLDTFNVVNPMIEPIGLVDSIPSVASLMNVALVHDGKTGFDVTISNIESDTSLFRRISEGVWLVHDAIQKPIFTAGTVATDTLQNLAQYNTNVDMSQSLASQTGFSSILAPGAFALNDSLFFIGIKASPELESLAEDGDPSGFKPLDPVDSLRLTGVFDTPVGLTEPGPIATGDAYSFRFNANNGDFFSLATMIVESNDWFIGANYIPLFQNGLPLSGEITSIMRVWDAGTEIDEFPGIGLSQGARQPGLNIGASEGENLDQEISEEFSIPDMYSMVKVTLRAN